MTEYEKQVLVELIEYELDQLKSLAYDARHLSSEQAQYLKQIQALGNIANKLGLSL